MRPFVQLVRLGVVSTGRSRARGGGRGTGPTRVATVGPNRAKKAWRKAGAHREAVGEATSMKQYQRPPISLSTAGDRGRERARRRAPQRATLRFPARGVADVVVGAAGQDG